MLLELYIENIALIDKLSLQLGDGLNILSGETGAGKSIIIDSLNFVLGERADKSLIRYGADFAVVQAVFDNYQNAPVLEYLSQMDIDAEDVLILRRKMSQDGKNECRINGRTTTLSILRGLTELLVDIHGQHEHQSLLKNSNHIKLLDVYGGEKIASLAAKTASAYRRYADVKSQLNSFGDSDERARRLDILKYQIDEIEAVNVKEGEENELLKKRKLLRNMEKISYGLEISMSELDGFGADQFVTALIKSSISRLNSISAFDDRLPSLIERLEGAMTEVEDISSTLHEMYSKLNYDDFSAEEIEERLEQVRTVTRKYGGSFEALTDFYEKAKEEQTVLSGADETVARLENEKSKAKKELEEVAAALSKCRIAAAEKFEKAVVKELADLGMGGSTFKVDIKTTIEADSISENGGDSVEFLISPNVGEPLKPLAKIISGGEMSRFMLALKNIVANIDNIGTMVFDEIDTGISGKISAVVSEKLCNISRARQVIAVTHMPSLAAMADNHYLIEKNAENGKTLTHVTRLEDDTDEVARLIGGNDYSEYAVPHAKEMKAWAARYKQSLLG